MLRGGGEERGERREQPKGRRRREREKEKPIKSASSPSLPPSFPSSSSFLPRVSRLYEKRRGGEREGREASSLSLSPSLAVAAALSRHIHMWKREEIIRHPSLIPPPPPPRLLLPLSVPREGRDCFLERLLFLICALSPSSSSSSSVSSSLFSLIKSSLCTDGRPTVRENEMR